MSLSFESDGHSPRPSFTIDVSKDDGIVVSDEAYSPMKIHTNSPFLRLPYQHSFDAENSNMSDYDHDRSHSSIKTSVVSRSFSSAAVPSTSRYVKELLTQPLVPSSINRSLSNPLFPRTNQATAPIGSQRITRHMAHDTIANHEITPFTMRVFSNPVDERLIEHIRTVQTLSPPTPFTAVLRSNVSGPVLVLPTVDDELKTWMESKRRRSAYVLKSSPVAYRTSSTSNAQLVHRYSQEQNRLSSRTAGANHDAKFF
jgi:hypothetical protein